MLKLYQSNRLEYLADLLAELTLSPLADPLAPEIVVVPHAGMGRWLSLRLAESAGICANVTFPLPATFIWQMLNQLLGTLPEQDRFSPDVMQWAIHAELYGVASDPRFQPVTDYLEAAGEAGRYDLAAELARCFDQYLVYRPEWVIEWERGDSATLSDQWQAALWRLLNRRLGRDHWISYQQRALALLNAADPDSNVLPERISLFAVHTLSPGYLQLLQGFSRRTEVHLYQLNPCEMEWTGIWNPAAISARQLETGGEEEYLDAGNPLLASWGTLGRDFQRLLLTCEPAAVEIFEDPGEGTLLHRVQGDILHLEDATTGPGRTLAAEDHSIQIHACHTPMREVEVLRDQLLDLLHRLPGLQPDDVLVMTPDLDLYAPYITAVFDSPPASRQLPHSITDRSLPADSALVDAFLQLLESPGSRYQCGELLSLLEIPAIQRRFGISEGDLPTLSRWVRDTSIRWSRDGAGRKALGLPDTDLNSWQAGLDRMLLGYALPAGEARLFDGVLPYDPIEGSESQLLGAFSAFVQAVFSLAGQLGGTHTMPVWTDRLLRLLDRFFDPLPDEEPVLRTIRDQLNAMERYAQLGGSDHLLPLEVISRHLSRQLEAASGIGGGFLTSGITFCALTPMRCLPFQVVCLLGLNDGNFPRNRQLPGFDLMAGNFRPGDRPRRLDDRYLFLEAIISARQCLYISYIGQSVYDNTPLAPSVFVSELIDYLRKSSTAESGRWPAHRFPRRHPLQAFDFRYFQGGGELFSYADEMVPASRASLTPGDEGRMLIPAPLPEPGDEWRQVDLQSLEQFFNNPVRFLLRERLGIAIDRTEGPMDSRDPIALDWRHGERIGKRLLEAELSSPEVGAEDLYALERAAGRLPHGEVGRQAFRALQRIARRRGEALRAVMPAAADEPLAIDVSLDAFRITGTITGISAAGIAGFSFRPLSAGRLLGLWIKHLLLNLAGAGDVEAQTQWQSGDELIRFPPNPDAEQIVTGLLHCYWQGLRQPLHLFPKSSLAYAESRLQGKDGTYCLNQAAAKWWGGYRTSSEFDVDPYYRLVFPGGDVLDSDFCQLSDEVFAPLLRARERR